MYAYLPVCIHIYVYIEVYICIHISIKQSPNNGKVKKGAIDHGNREPSTSRVDCAYLGVIKVKQYYI